MVWKQVELSTKWVTVELSNGRVLNSKELGGNTLLFALAGWYCDPEQSDEPCTVVSITKWNDENSSTTLNFEGVE
jgi:hypothetical protein